MPVNVSHRRAAPFPRTSAKDKKAGGLPVLLTLPTPVVSALQTPVVPAPPGFAPLSITTGDAVAGVMVMTGSGTTHGAELGDRPPHKSGYRRVRADTTAQACVLTEASAFSPLVSGPPRNTSRQPHIIAAGGANPHVFGRSGDYYGRHETGELVCVRDVNYTLTWGADVFSVDLLRLRGCRFRLEGDDDDLHFLVPTGNGGYLRVPLVTARCIFFFDVKGAPEVYTSTAAATTLVVAAIAALRSYPAPPAPPARSRPGIPAPRLAAGFKPTRENLPRMGLGRCR